jgi:TPR repeat protein
MYEKGLGVPRDYDKAKYWREKADAQKKRRS